MTGYETQTISVLQSTFAPGEAPGATSLGGGQRAEWRQHWPIALSACVGFSAFGLHMFAFGPFVVPIQNAFGWSRTEVLLGLTVSNLMSALLTFMVGLAIDRVGPRRVGLIGVVVKCTAFALLATATGSLFNWAALWAVSACGSVLVSAMVWTRGVTGAFRASRGLAIAVALSGSSLTASLSPIASTWLMTRYGWRASLAGTGLIWLVIVLPIVFLFFRVPRPVDDSHPVVKDRKAPVAPLLPGLTLSQGVRTSVFWRLAIANAGFIFYTVALAPNLIPLLAERGIAPAAAASVAALAGIAGFIARLLTGLLLDRLPTRAVSGGVFALAVTGCLLLLGHNSAVLPLAVAMVCVGATAGAEYDVVLYLASRHFGLRRFGALIGAMMSGAAVVAAAAPVVAGWIRDSGSYDPLLIGLVVIMGLNAVGMLTLPPPPEQFETVDA